jgi:chemotaxis signal transduction protein
VIATEGFLVVRAGADRYGIGLSSVREVVDVPPPRPVPARTPALRGVMPLRERFLSLVHLGALLAGGVPPGAAGDTAVVVEVGETVVALEVDEVLEVVEGGATFVGSAPAAWASGIWRVGTELVTVIDPAALAERLTSIEEPR